MSDITIRPARNEDVDGIVALVEDRIGAEDAPEARLVLEDPSFDRRRWSVAVDGDRVVSTMASFPMHIGIGSVQVPGSQIEFVATDSAYEGRGLVRRQFDHHHADAARRGEIFQVIVGITYFYRRLGYEYALQVADWRSIAPDTVPARRAGWTTRIATSDDVETVMELQTRIQGAADVRVRFAPDLWRYVLRSPVYATIIAEHGGVPLACGRLYLDDDEPYVMDFVAGDAEGLGAVLAAIADRAPGQSITIMDRPGMLPLLAEQGTAASPGDWYYARIGDPAAFLNAMRPELSRRLAASDLASANGTGLISPYTTSLHFSYAGGVVGEFATGGVEQAPISKGGSGVAPDLFTSLVVGPRGFAGLEELHPDVMGGSQRDLMVAMFPPQTADVQSWVVP